MATKTYLAYENAHDDIKSSVESMMELYDDDLELIVNIANLTGNALQVSELYHMQLCAFELITNNYLIYSNDTFERKSVDLLINDEVLINTLTNSFLSCSNNLVQSIEYYALHPIKITESTFEQFKEIHLSKAYDGSIYYRFLYHMRNYTQHNHTCVKVNDGKFCFPLDGIIDSPKFNHNKKIKDELEKIIVEIRCKYNDVANFAYFKSIIEYYELTINIYNEFLKKLNIDMNIITKEIRKITEKYGVNVISLSADNNIFIYKDKNSEINGIQILENYALFYDNERVEVIKKLKCIKEQKIKMKLEY